MMEVLWLVLLSVLLTLALVQRIKNKKIRKYMDSVPGPPSIPFLGNIYIGLNLNTENLWGKIKKMMAMYPSGQISFWFVNQPWIFSADLNVLNALWSSSSNTNKSDVYEFFKGSSNGGILSSNGKDWRGKKKSVMPSIRSAGVFPFGGLNHHVQFFIKNWEKHADSQQPFDPFVPVHLYLTDVLSESLIECRMDVQKRNLTYIPKNLVTSLRMLYGRFLNPLLHMKQLWILSGGQREMRKLSKGLRNLAEEMFDKRMNARDPKAPQLSSSMQERKFMECLIRNVTDEIITKEDAVMEIVDVMIGGSVTAAVTTSWLFHVFALRPEIQEAAYREVKEICQGPEITPEDVSKMVYLEMVVKEVLRHFTVPFVSRYINEDLKVDDKTTIPEGVRLVANLYSLHHDPRYWEKPYDFYPEHFSPANERNRPNGAFVPFLSGPRLCPGFKYAYRSVKYLAANVLLNFEFTAKGTPSADFYNADYNFVVLLWPKSGFEATIKRRNNQDEKQSQINVSNGLTVSCH